MSLTRSDAVIALGKRLVVCLQAGDDLLSGWMAHHLAELITTADTASLDTRATANAACATAVLEVWRHRNTLPQHLRPLGELEPILATLAALDVDPSSFRYHSKTLRSAALAKAEGNTKKWLEIAFGLDQSARALIGLSLRVAAAYTDDVAEDWVELARQTGEDQGSEAALVDFLKLNFDTQVKEPKQQLSNMEEQIQRLRNFADIANVAADDIQSWIEPEIRTKLIGNKSLGSSVSPGKITPATVIATTKTGSKRSRTRPK